MYLLNRFEEEAKESMKNDTNSTHNTFRQTNKQKQNHKTEYINNI